MDRHCSACGEPNPDRARYCLACGTPMPPPGAGEDSHESRRTLTVLFADVVGFTALGDRLDSESLRRVMDRFYAEMRRAVEARDGTVAKFIGDAVMAVWGTPVVREDDAVRAVHAAADMRGALAALNEDLDRRWGVRLGLRTGVNTGEMVVDPAKGADLLVGDTLNVAARLEQAAGDGEILIGPDTARLVRHEVDLEPVEPLHLKGKPRPVAAWRLALGLGGDRRRAPRLQAPLVGREREIARLRSAFYGTKGAGETRVITVIGSPGVGKTRLVADFVAGLGDEAGVVVGRCEASGEGLTFLPVAEILCRAAGIDAADDAQSAREKLARAIPGDEQRDLVAERALTILGFGHAVGVEETFWAIRRLFQALAAERPLVVVLDDVHWAQPTLLDLVEHLAVWGRESPVLVVAVARPELRELRPSLAEPGELVTDAIDLEPLDDEDSRTLVGRMLGGADLPDELAERVLEATEGNPLFLGETLRMLADEGVLQRDRGGWWVAEDDPSRVTVPPTIQALLSARIARLTAGERRVVECASVIGGRFTRGAVRHLASADPGVDVDACLASLKRKELVARTGAEQYGEPVLRFHHMLIRDAAYRSLLKEERAALHERLATWLEASAADADEVAGFHLERAHAYLAELGPLGEAGEAIGVRAAERLHAAARRALAREDLPAAANLLDRALVLLALEDDARRTAILLDLAEALLSAGDTASAEDVVEELLLRGEGDARLGAWGTVFACQLANLAGAEHVRETIGRGRHAAAVLAAAGDQAGEAKALQVVAEAHALLGQVAAVQEALDRAVAAARDAGDQRRATAVLSRSPRAALWGPQPIVRASGLCLDVVRILRLSPGNRHLEATALQFQAVLEAMRARPDAARRLIARSRETLSELGLAYELTGLAEHAGLVELLAGDHLAAERELRTAKQAFAELGVETSAAQAAAFLARALLAQDRDDAAEAETRYAEAHGGEDLKTSIAWRGVRAEALARRGEHDEALALARRAVELAETTDALADRADALMALAAVLRLAGRDADAKGAALGARELYAAKDHAVGVARAEAAAGIAPAAEPAPRRAPAAPPPSTSRGLRRRTSRDRTTLCERTRAAITAALNEHRWDDLRVLHAPDVVTHDRRALGHGVVTGADQAVAIVRGIEDVAGTVRWNDRVTATWGERLTAGPLVIDVTQHDGGSAEAVVWQVILVDPDGHTRRFDMVDDEEEALARMRELGRWVDGLDDFARRLPALEWEELSPQYGDHVEFVDRRAGEVHELPDIETFWRTVFAENEALGVSYFLLDSRASGRLSSSRLHVDGTALDGTPFELLADQVIELDDEGRAVRIELFDPQDPGVATRLEELERESATARRPSG